MEYHTYVISSCQRKYIYVGITNGIHRRLNEHNKGYNKTTKPYAPFKLIYEERFENRRGARIKEKFFKSGFGREQIKNLINK